MMHTHTAWTALAAGLALAAGAAPTLAGDLTPPGAPAPTMKTLDEVEARTPVGPLTTPGSGLAVFNISQPGSYYLTGNVVGEDGKAAIRILADGVTLDLNGFDIVGDATADGGVLVDVRRNITIRNGSIRGFEFQGLAAANGRNMLIENLTVEGSGAEGIVVGSNSLVVNCTVRGVGATGIFTGTATTIRNCSLVSPGGDGIITNLNCVVVDTTVEGAGLNGIAVNAGSVVRSSTARLNGQAGIYAVGAATISDCSVRSNTGAGVLADGRVSLRGVVSEENNAGFDLNAGATARDCVASNNAGLGFDSRNTESSFTGCSAVGNGGGGFYTSVWAATYNNCSATDNGAAGFFGRANSTVIGCIARGNGGRGFDFSAGVIADSAAYQNQSDGFRVNTGAIVRNCSAFANGGHGIRANRQNQILSNTCEGNGTVTAGAGVFVSEQRNRVEGNHLINNDFGIQGGSFATGNIFVRNTTANNGQEWDVDGTTNSGAEIFDVSTGVTITTHNGWANFIID